MDGLKPGTPFAVGHRKMDAIHPGRPAATPIIRVDGNNVNYLLWVEQGNRPCELLVLRCDGAGGVFASISDGVEECIEHTRL